ncbi:hypothetical protein DM01DRAFT_1339870 [Hesseltinella vesiculosa]|uniref:WAC domain-containing protein n=1 Tax=Hesseltinella vesiculosa TaxID=101127 RepID=A0A1X2G604_9FUNG|nr:hypothetical protein DM01DRAFT_1339870 [Hesseltinella vesiculosa]
MPLLKRKHLDLIDPPPLDLSSNASSKQQVWYCPVTQELFDDYSAYVERTFILKQPLWQCESTGRINLTYQQAAESERVEKGKLQGKLPDSLQKALLIHAQFHNARLDKVVDDVHSYFESRYVVGEQLSCDWEAGTWYTANILEAPPLDEQISDDVKYKIQLVDEDFNAIDEYIKVMPRSAIRRDRFALSKSLLKRFFREALTKESYLGAPWVVELGFAQRFGIDTTLPKDLAATRDTAIRKSKKLKEQVLAERQLELKKSGLEDSADAKRIEANLKYPMEDLDLPAYRRVPPVGPFAVIMDMTPGTNNELKPVPNPMGDMIACPLPKQESTIAAECFGSFLMVWSFLNVFSRPLCLSPFSLDDFESSLRYNSTDTKCELVYEVIASLLNCLIRHRLVYGRQTTMPLSSFDMSSSSSPAPSPRLQPAHHLASQMDELALEDGTTPASPTTNGRHAASTQDNGTNSMDLDEPQPTNGHIVAIERGCGTDEVVKIGGNWDSAPLDKGNHRQGWQDVLIGCINDLVFELHADTSTYDTIMCQLVPKLNSASRDRELAYLSLSLKDKLTIFELLVHAVNETQAIKEYMETCQEQLTELRKEKMELGREKKRIIAERSEHEKRCEEEEVNNMSTTSSVQNSDDESSALSDEDSASDPRAMSQKDRIASRQANLKRMQQEREEVEKKRRKLQNQQRQIARERTQEMKARATARRRLDTEEQQVLRKLDQVERDLRRYSTLRCKPIGRDKFYNRYYYLDNVGGAHAHGTGRLFVQSPSLSDLMYLLERDSPAFYTSAADKLPVPVNEDGTQEVKKPEENPKKSASLACGHGGGISFMCQLMEHQGMADKAACLKSNLDNVKSGHDVEWWESIDEPETLDQLMEWLNPKGTREHALRKELTRHWQGLTQGMKKMHADRQQSNGPPEVTRRSTRTKSTVVYAPGSWFSYTNKLAK